VSILAGRRYQLFKYTVYTLLAVNVLVFFREEWDAATTRFGAGVAAADVIEAFASTIDTAAWVGLLLLFELETSTLDDRWFTPGRTLLLRGLRAGCYAVIVYAFYGYVASLVFTYAVVPLVDTNDLCALANLGWAFATTLDQYVAITTANCARLTDADLLLRFEGINAVTDSAGIANIRSLAWADAINGGVWLLVVVLLEADVWLQEQGRYEGTALMGSTLLKAIFYSILAAAVVFWMWQGQVKDWWDALLWIIAFVFIELNIFEWRAEEQAALEAS
jgi:hypothetical protein